MDDPALYAAADDISHRIASYFIDEFTDEFGKMSGRCLDIGTGPGDLAVDLILPILNKKANLVCLDISQKMLNFAKDKYKDNERLSFLKLDIETPDLPKNLVEQFDHATSFWCIHWCQDMRQVFENIFDLLRPGGSTFLLFIASSSGVNSYKKLATMPRYQPYIKDADRYIPVFQYSSEPRKTLKALIEDVGFEVPHCSVRERTHTFDDPEIFDKFVLSIHPFLNLIPADLVEDYKKDLFNEYARHCIVFNKDNGNENEYNILAKYQVFIIYLKKPLVNNKRYSKE